MKRIYTKDLEAWLSKKDRKPLIVWGARQVGKTYLVVELFAKKKFSKSFIYIDFKIEDEIREFCAMTANPDRIIEYISLVKNAKIGAETLLIFDEIQECPNIISALKYFCQNRPEIPVIATGSMVRIKLQRENTKRGSAETQKFLFPVGKIDQITIHAMSFDEFLFNSNETLYETIKSHYHSKKPLTKEIHVLALNYLDKYLLIGGMPEAVDAFLEDGDYLRSREILESLYDNYLADMELYQASRESILRSRLLFQNIYRELNKESMNFSPGLISNKSKTRDFATPIEWLTMAHIINQSYLLKDHITMPLMHKSDSYFRLFLGDIGMFSYQSGVSPTSFINPTEKNTLTGVFYENYVANELVAKGNKLFYWRGKNSAEFEFIVQSNNKIFPIDVKKNKGTLNSLVKFGEHNKFECAIKISRNNYGLDSEKKLLTLPLYYAPFLAKDLKEGTFMSL